MIRITLSQTELKAMLQGFSRITAGTTLPVLKHVLLNVTNEESLSISATNLDETLVYTPEHAEVSGSGSVLLNIEDLKTLAKANSPVTLVYEEETLMVQTLVGSQVVSRTLTACAADDFPMTTFKVEQFGAVDLGVFMSKLHTAMTAASCDQTRYVLNGVFFNSERQELVGTDGRRLVLLQTPELSLQEDVIVRSSKLLRSPLFNKETQGEVGVANIQDRRYFSIRSSRWLYEAPGIDGLYPNYRLVIPADAAATAHLTLTVSDVKILDTAIRQFPCHDADQAVVLYADNERAAVVSVGDAEHTHVQLPDARFQGEAPFLLTVNRQFLSDALTGGFRQLHMGTQTSPVRCTSSEGLYVLMPLRSSVAGGAEKYLRRTFGFQPQASDAPVEAMTPEVATVTEPAAGTLETTAFNGPVGGEDAGSSPEVSQEPNAEVSPEPGTEPSPEPKPEHNTEPAKEKTVKQTMQTHQGLKPDLTLVDPMEQLQQEAEQVAALLLQALSAVRSLSKSARAATREVKSREKLLANREKDLKAITSQITKLAS